MSRSSVRFRQVAPLLTWTYGPLRSARRLRWSHSWCQLSGVVAHGDRLRRVGDQPRRGSRRSPTCASVAGCSYASFMKINFYLSVLLGTMASSVVLIVLFACILAIVAVATKKPVRRKTALTAQRALLDALPWSRARRDSMLQTRVRSTMDGRLAALSQKSKRTADGAAKRSPPR